MSKFPDDELLSAIIDGEASAESIASVEADPEQSKRLEDMRSAVEIVATTPPAATSERRSASIAAAMAAATPASPEVTSLAAKRHERDKKKRSIPGAALAAAAAVLLFVLAIPLIFGLGGGGEVDLVADAADETVETNSNETVATSSEESGDAAATEAVAGVEEAAEESEAMEDDEEIATVQSDSAADEDAMEDEAEEEAAAADDSEGSDQTNGVAVDTQIVQSIEELDDLISAGSIAPVLAGEDLLARQAPVARLGESIDEALATDVNPDCLVAGDRATLVAYDIAVLDPFAGSAELVIIEFLDDETTRVLNAETCEVIR